MSAFVQIIEFQTDRIDEIRGLQDEMRERNDTPRFTSGVMTKDRTKPDTYTMVVEFPSYEAAEANNADPQIQQFAARMEQLCKGPAVFHDLDVIERIP
jgi:quinol monooxygenase YgiN